MIIGLDDQCICQEDTFQIEQFFCIPCPPDSSTYGMTGAQSVHNCGKYDSYFSKVQGYDLFLNDRKSTTFIL